MYVTFVVYSLNIQGISLYSILSEYYLGIFSGISLGTFSGYSGNISWEFSTNIYLLGGSNLKWIKRIVSEEIYKV